MPTNEERREVAENLRNMCICGCRYREEFYDLLVETVMRAWDFHEFSGCGRSSRRTHQPEERTCHIEPLSLHEFFAGEKYILSSDAKGEQRRTSALTGSAVELEEDAHFTCSSCHALFGTRGGRKCGLRHSRRTGLTKDESGVAPILLSSARTAARGWCSDDRLRCHGEVCREYLRQHKGIICRTCPDRCRFYEPKGETAQHRGAKLAAWPPRGRVCKTEARRRWPPCAAMSRLKAWWGACAAALLLRGEQRCEDALRE